MKHFIAKFILLSTTIFVTSCVQHDRFFFVDNLSDTTFIDKPSFDTVGLTIVNTKEFLLDKNINGQIIVLTNEETKPIPPPDGGVHYYMTSDLGIIYSHNTYSEEESQLHSTNITTEKKIRLYVDFIKRRLGK